MSVKHTINPRFKCDGEYPILRWGNASALQRLKLIRPSLDVARLTLCLVVCSRSGVLDVHT